MSANGKVEVLDVSTTAISRRNYAGRATEVLSATLPLVCYKPNNSFEVSSLKSPRIAVRQLLALVGQFVEQVSGKLEMLGSF